MIHKYAEIFCWKNVSSFCSAKATHILSAKNIRILYIESAKTVNEMTLHELIKLTTLWTTGPRWWHYRAMTSSWIWNVNNKKKSDLRAKDKNNCFVMQNQRSKCIFSRTTKGFKYVSFSLLHRNALVKILLPWKHVFKWCRKERNLYIHRFCYNASEIHVVLEVNP